MLALVRGQNCAFGRRGQGQFWLIAHLRRAQLQLEDKPRNVIELGHWVKHDIVDRVLQRNGVLGSEPQLLGLYAGTSARRQVVVTQWQHRNDAWQMCAREP